jgi:hypothetical protein
MAKKRKVKMLSAAKNEPPDPCAVNPEEVA